MDSGFRHGRGAALTKLPALRRCHYSTIFWQKMDSYNIIKDELVAINQSVHQMLSQVETFPGFTEHAFNGWRDACRGIGRQIAEEKMRVAVVGPIKSGKSTFLNALFGADYLKRGAGVVTSIVTRIESGSTLRAKLVFKSWEEVNRDMAQAMVLFPAAEFSPDADGFDVRRAADRENLAKALANLNPDLLLTRETRNVNSVLLDCYLNGYDHVRDILADRETTRHYEGADFAGHMAFTGSDNLAVYVRDISLTIDAHRLDAGVEIADCQGSDSPNPLHMAMIQDYLARTHLIVYVISSRTGLRQADIRFLSMIKTMGIMDHILFVVNCDFSEHESLAELGRLTDKLAAELALLKPAPDIYVFSALFNLFKARQADLSAKDRLRLDQWNTQTDLAAFSDRETLRWDEAFYRKLTRERRLLLLGSSLERIGVIASGVENWLRINHDIFNREASAVTALAEKIKYHQRHMDTVRAMIRSTLDGSLRTIKNRLRDDLDRFFDPRSGEIVKDIIGFIRNYAVPVAQYEDQLRSGGFSDTLYAVFQEFRQSLDRYIAETITPRIIRFVREEERKISDALTDVTGPFEAMVRDAVGEYAAAMADFGIALNSSGPVTARGPDIEALKASSGLVLPPVAATMRYSAKIKTEAVVRLGAYSLAGLFRRLLKKPVDPVGTHAGRALKDSSTRMKRETRQSIVFNFKDYRENLKYQYVFKLLDAAAADLYQSLIDRFQGYAADLSQTIDLIGRKKIDRRQTAEFIEQMQQTAAAVQANIRRTRDKIQEKD